MQFFSRLCYYLVMTKNITEKFNGIIREYTIRVFEDRETGIKTGELWQFERQLHREDGLPAELEWDPKTGVCTLEGYYLYGNPNRDGAPAIIRRHPITGEVIGETWAQGSLLRDGDLPAIWSKDPDTGIIEREEYYMDGVLHRDDGKPAVIIRDPKTGEVIQLEYHDYGEEIRVDENPNWHPALEP